MLMPSVPPFESALAVSFLGHTATGTDTATPSFASRPLGVLGTKTVAIFVARAGSSISLSSCTIDGVAATCATLITGTTCVAIAVINSTGNATGTVAPTWSGSADRTAVATYQLSGPCSATPTATGNDASDPYDYSLTCIAGSVVIAGGADAGITSFTPTALTEDADTTTNFESQTYTFASAAFATAQAATLLRLDVASATGGAGGFAVFSPT